VVLVRIAYSSAPFPDARVYRADELRLERAGPRPFDAQHDLLADGCVKAIAGGGTRRRT
jgi:hypothetical protein